MSVSGKKLLKFSRRLAIVAILISAAVAGAMVGLVYAPSSPGFPFLSPTYQAQRAPFQYQGFSVNAALYEVWYVVGTQTLILAIMAGFPQTHFFGVGAVGFGSQLGFSFTNSPQGNFSTSVYVNDEKTYLVFPGNLCPDTSQIPASGYNVSVDLLADSPPAILSFQYTCQHNPNPIMLVLGNPHIIVPRLIPSTPPPVTTGRESLSMDSYAFSSTNSTMLTLYLRNTGTASTTLVSYYVKDSSGNQWALTGWSGPTINPNAVSIASIGIGSSCGSCTYSGSSGAFTQFSAGYSYTIVVVTSRNNQFTFIVVK